MPVYGCGFLGEDSVWKTGSLAKMSPNARERWLREFDPSRYLSGVGCPILFLDGSNDFAYPLDSVRASYRLVQRRFRHISIILNLPHGHIWTFEEVDRFADSILRGETPLPSLSTMKIDADKATTHVVSRVPLKQAGLNYTTDTCEWQKRRWQTVAAEVDRNTISAHLPQQRPLVYYLSVTDQRNLRVSTEHEEIPINATPVRSARRAP